MTADSAGRGLSPPDPQFCYVTTRGRVTGKPHEIEIWFAREPDASTIYLLSGGRILEPDSDEDALARRLLEERYGHTMDLTRWLRESLPVAIDLGVLQ